MVRCRGTTEWTVVEHHQLRIMIQQLYHLAVHSTNLLCVMTTGGDGEMHRQDGVGIDQQLIVHILHLGQLFLRAVLSAEETGTGGYRLLSDGGAGRTDAGGVELHFEGRRSHVQLAGLHMTQFTIAFTRLRPQAQLAIEKTVE